MLDLNTGVDLDKVVPALLVDQELSSTSIPVANALRQFDRVREDCPTNFLRKVRCRSDLDDLLVTTLYGTVAFEKVDGIAKRVSKELDLNVTGTFEEPLNKDGAITECRFGFGHGPLEGIFEVGLLTNDTHTTSASAHGGLDDN